VPYDQLDQLRQVLEARGFRFSVQSNIISLSGGPFFAVVNLSWGTDVSAAQAALDSVS
jgi:hypothetical protein